MTSSSAAKGKRFERELREGLRGHGFDIEKLNLAGAEDEADLLVRLNYDPDRTGLPLPNRSRLVIEAKNTAQLNLAGHTAEALVEADNYAAHRKLDREGVLALAVLKRRGAGWKDAYVVTTVREFFGLT